MYPRRWYFLSAVDASMDKTLVIMATRILGDAKLYKSSLGNKWRLLCCQGRRDCTLWIMLWVMNILWNPQVLRTQVMYKSKSGRGCRWMVAVLERCHNNPQWRHNNFWKAWCASGLQSKSLGFDKIRSRGSLGPSLVSGRRRRNNLGTSRSSNCIGM